MVVINATLAIPANGNCHKFCNNELKSEFFVLGLIHSFEFF